MEQLTQFNTGGRHENNPLGGIPQGIASNGQPNLVEEGETKLNSSNYIFSDRLILNKELVKQYNLPNSSVGKTFAEVSKKLNNSNSRRENDSIEENDKKKNLDKLMYAQEDFKQKELESDMMAMMDKHPELANMMQQSYQPTQMMQQVPQQEQVPQEIVDPNMQQEQPMMAKGGYMYPDGGLINTSGPRVEEESATNYISDGMVKGRIAISDAFNNPSAKRMVSPNPKTYDFGNGEIGTHYMMSMDNYAVPALQDKGEKELTLNLNPDPSKEDIKFNSPEEAQYFAENYKRFAPMMNNFKNGGGLFRNVGTMLNAASPYLSKIPGIGTVAGMAAGAVGAGLQNVGTGADLKEVAADSLFGAGKGASGSIPGGSMIYGQLENLNPYSGQKNSFPDGGKLETKENPYYKQQQELYTGFSSPEKFIQYKEDRFIEGPELDKWYAQRIKNNPQDSQFIGNYKPKRVYLGDSEDQYYPVYNKPEKTVMVPPAVSSDVQVPLIKPVVNNEENTTKFSYRPQTYYQQDSQGNWGQHQVRSSPYYNLETKQSLNTPGVVWLTNTGEELTVDPRTQTPQTLAYGGGIDTSSISKPFIGPQNYDPTLNNNYETPISIDQNFNPSMQYPLNFDQANLYNTVDYNDQNIEEEGARMLMQQDGGITEEDVIPRQEGETEEEYQRRIYTVNENLNDNNQDLRVQQTKGQAVAQLAPVAYNLGMGIFSKPTQLNPDDYLKGTKIVAPEIDVTPQVREGQQSYATAQNSIANSGVSGGAYLTNLQQLASDRNKNLGQIYTQKENIDAQNKMQADQFNASMQANNNQTRFQIEDYNARAKAAKQQMLQEGIGQVADLANNKTANQLATSYYSLNAPDFAGQVGYTSYWDYLKNKKAEKNTNQ